MSASISTRDRILRAALEEFSARGFSATSMRRLAALVRIRPASLYSHFSSKENILAELLHQKGPDSAVELLAKARSLEQEPARQITSLVRLAAATWSTREARLFRSLHSRLTGDETVQTRYLDGVRRALTATTELFEEWIQRGVIDGDFGAQHLAWELWAPIGNLRTSFWNLESSEEEVAEGVAIALMHASYFIQRNRIAVSDTAPRGES